MSNTRISPSFHVMSKPAGAACNSNCGYCFYLKKGALYPRGSMETMSDEVLSAMNQKLNALIAEEIGEDKAMFTPPKKD